MSTAFGVYIHARPDGTAFYVGKGRRSRAHNLTPSRRSKHHANIVAKCGCKNIIVDFVPCASEVEALALETEWIRIMRVFGAKLCNMTEGGEGTSGYVHTTETRAKIGARKVGKKRSDETREKLRTAQTGKKSTEDTRSRISASQKGKTLSLEHRAKLSAAQIGNTNGLGSKRSDETRAKMSAAQIGNTKWLGRTHTAESRAKISAANMGNKSSLGRVLTAEHRAKLSAAAKAQWARIKQGCSPLPEGGAA